jgi:1-acyl-sn-glycerol-3-phosphate acyltransferase
VSHRERPDLLRAGAQRLSRLERIQIATVRRTFEPGMADHAIRWCQRTVGCRWITTATQRLRHVHGEHLLPKWDPTKSYMLVTNHRSFFDLYVITGHLVRRGLSHRLVFPVRSEFFYDHPLGLAVNGVMSFFAMYPPVFRDRKRAMLNLVGLDEIASLLGRGGHFLGIHPEGTRNQTGDPYTLLPAQSGVGRLVHKSDAVVIPAFVAGLINDFPRQIFSNFDGTGAPIHIVFGEPLDLAELRARPGSPRSYRAIAEHLRDRITELGAEERRLRREAGHPPLDGVRSTD